jgi:formylglycine-generating enzyme required for sulfatase activity
METKSVYGWGTSGTGIDTHLMKNIEWGAVTYLSKSSYGQNTNEIWINNANNYTTGCAGTSVSEAASTTGCINAYNTANGVKASTTGNIYGVYDMSGGAWEFVSAYLNNGGATLSNGSTITGAAAQYKDIYSVTTDNQATNYSNAANKKGDALYETSSAATGAGVSWFGDSANMPYSAGSGSWFIRGARFVSTTQAGPYIFYDAGGVAGANIGFRPVLIVGTGL